MGIENENIKGEQLMSLLSAIIVIGAGILGLILGTVTDGILGIIVGAIGGLVLGAIIAAALERKQR